MTVLPISTVAARRNPPRRFSPGGEQKYNTVDQPQRIPDPGAPLAMKFVHAADLHIDSPLRGLAHYEGAPVERVRLATRSALENLVKICIEEGASFLVVAGDLFDNDWRDFNTALFVVK
jgi:hypothetical protein